MVISDQEREVIDTLLKDVNEKVNIIIKSRDDVTALLRIHSDIDSDAVENNVLSKAKERAKAAAEELVTLLS